MKKCGNCIKAIENKRAEAKHCSLKCKKNAMYKRKKAKEPNKILTVKLCEFCSNKFNVTTHNKKYCSRLCSGRANIEKRGQEYKDTKKIYNQRNSGKRNAATAKRRAAKLQATPPWVDDNMKLDIELIYMIASTYTKASQDVSISKEKYEVDHTIPLQGKTVSGLHVPWNLRVTTRTENRRKNNKLTGEL